MTYQEWKQIKSISGADNQKIIRDFELSNPHLAAMYEQQQTEEIKEMRQAMTIDDRMERWKKIAELNHDPTFAERRRREVM